MSRRLRVCVLISSYEGSDSALKEFDDLQQTPKWYFDPQDPQYLIDTIPIKKATSYRTIRALVKSGQYDVFYNQCDGSRDEDRAGEDVIRALEEFQVPFTGARSRFYELSKPEMKMIAFYNKIRTAKHAVLESAEEAEERCSGLRFPVIVKHVSGYSSIGMTKDCKCFNMEALKDRVERFVKEYQFALVEEFIEGDEATVLVCADATEPGGVRVFQPVQVQFPDGDDFKHFDLKWQTFEGMEWRQVDAKDPALPEMLDIAKKSFCQMMNGVGYGRVDLRIDRRTNEVFFLEINPNCGIMYPPGQEGSADWILKLSTDFGHRQFAALQMQEAIAHNESIKPSFRVDFSTKRGYHIRAVRNLKADDIIFKDEGRPFRLFTKPFVEKNWSEQEKTAFASSCWPVGTDRHYYAVWDLDPHDWRSFNHSCEPNMVFDENRSLNVVAIRDIAKGEELTMDYRTFCDDTTNSFTCNCGAPSCSGLIEFKQPRLTPIKRDRPSVHMN